VTLAEAIRIGAKRHPQAFGVSRLVDDHGSIIATCAGGAGLLVLNGENVNHVWWQLSRPEVACPKCGERKSLWVMIAHLNDVHRVTREWIADWLEPLELA
jgi:hypothetical protein